MKPPHHLSWEHFRSTVFVRGQQRVHRVSDSPHIEVFGDGILNRIGMWLEIAPSTAIPAEISGLASIAIQIIKHKGRSLLEVSTATPSLHRQFYHFAVAVAERVVIERQPAIEAVQLELQSFVDLLEQKPFLGLERQLGLLGELIFLERLVGHTGVGALDAWLGPMGEPHDFRLRAHEFEVKTTVSPHRIHTIHGAEQLMPSSACSLYLVSVLLGPAGASNGFSLAGKVALLTAQFTPVSPRLIQFSTALEASGFRNLDREHYTRQFAMRRPLGLVRVDEKFPAITRPTIQSALGSLAPRIESLQYDVSVEGLEYEEGTREFDEVIPP